MRVRDAGPRTGSVSVSVALVLMVLVAMPARAQAPVADVRDEVFVGSEIEQYLRSLQVAGIGSVYPWTIRGFSPHEVNRILPDTSTHPWGARYELRPDTASGLRLGWVRPRARVVFNSAFPYGFNDGPVWAGRGLTSVIQAGVSARYGPLSLVLAPIAFRAENTDFDIADTGRTGRLTFADPRNPTAIDFPQRFGDDPYSRVDPGESTLRLDLPYITLGVSTAGQQWGPASEHPILLGNNAGGFLHGFLGTSAPVDLWIGKLHGRVVWGRLEQSDYAVTRGTASRRFMSGIVGTFTPRGIPGFEIGGARFYHTPWPEGGLEFDHFTRPLEELFKSELPESNTGSPDPRADIANQIAAVFFRWVHPQSGFEVYGEYGREDHSWDLRDFLLEPDHSGGYMFGLQKVWQPSPTQFVALRGEVLKLEISNIGRTRNQAPFYRHSRVRQGHTNRGQILGSAAGYGGAASLVAVDYYHPGGRWSVGWTRRLRNETGEYSTGEAGNPDGLDVIHGLQAGALIFLGRFDVNVGITGAYNLNRYFRSDVFNVRLETGVQMGL